MQSKESMTKQQQGSGSITEKRKKTQKRKRKSSERDAEAEVVDASARRIATSAAGDVNIEEVPNRQKKKMKKARKRREGEGKAVARLVDVVATEAAALAAAVSDRSTAALLSCTSKAAEYASRLTASTSNPNEKETRAEEGTEKTGETNDNETPKSTRKKDRKERRQRSPSAKKTEPNSNTATSTVDDRNSTNSLLQGGNHNDDDDHDHDGSSSLEGVMHEGTMYLVDNRKRVFSVQRDTLSELVQVGRFDDGGGGGGGKVVLAKVASDSHPATATITEPNGKGREQGEGRGEATTAHVAEKPKDREKTKKKKKKKKKKGSTDVNKEKEEEAAATATAVTSGGRGAADAAVAPAETVVEVVDYPFEAEECDHCETSESAYADIVPLLTALAKELGKPPAELAIYDPYYCQGSTVMRLASLGFPRVHNRKEDFYEVVRAGRIPEHDVVVTNPPFSGDHVPSILRFCAQEGGKPWFLLLPNYVYLKDYFNPALSGGTGGRPLGLFYLTPAKRYSFYSPQGSRLSVKSSERKTSPFNTFWYIHLGDSTITSKILQDYDGVSRKTPALGRCCVARTAAQIPYKMMDSNDPRRKKARDRQRSIERIRKKKSEWGAAVN